MDAAFLDYSDAMFPDFVMHFCFLCRRSEIWNLDGPRQGL